VSLQTAEWTEIGLWAAVVASGVYHGVNPGMGWPLAVSAGLMGRGRRDLIAAFGPLAAGHFLAMAAILTPFAIMTTLIAWESQIRIGAGMLVIAAGAYLLIQRRHPRFLARIFEPDPGRRHRRDERRDRQRFIGCLLTAGIVMKSLGSSSRRAVSEYGDA